MRLDLKPASEVQVGEWVQDAYSTEYAPVLQIRPYGKAPEHGVILTVKFFGDKATTDLYHAHRAVILVLVPT